MKRTHHQIEFKEAIDTGSVAVVVFQYGLSSNMVNSWINEYKEEKYVNVNPTLWKQKIISRKQLAKKFIR